MNRMNPEDIPDFVAEVVATGCDITAVADGYVVGDADLTGAQYEKAAPILKEIGERYGERDHLLREISRYLVSIGRVYPPPSRH